MSMAIRSRQEHNLVQSSIKETRGLTEFTYKVRGPNNDGSGKYSIKKRDLQSIFEQSSWQYQPRTNGCQKWIHPLTRVSITYVDRKNDIDPGTVSKVFAQVQKHLDALKAYQ